MKKNLYNCIAAFMAITILFTSTANAWAHSSPHEFKCDANENILTELSGEILIQITEECTEDEIIYREYHDSVLVDTLFVEKSNNHVIESNTMPVPQSMNERSNKIELGSVYFNVQYYSQLIRADLSYELNGKSDQKTYTVKNHYASALALAVDLAAAIFMPESLAITVGRKLVTWGILKVVTTGLDRIAETTLSAKIQKEIFYVYLPYQPPEQAEFSKTYYGTVYTINDAGAGDLYGEVFYDGYTSAGWGKNDFGIQLGNNLFLNYNIVDRWEEA